MPKKYTKEQIAFLRENAPGNTRATLLDKFNAAFDLDLTEATLKSTMQNHKIKVGIRETKNNYHLLTPEQEDFVQANCLGIGNKELTQSINEKFGTNFTVKQIRAYKKNHDLRSGLTGYFEKGHVPVNKGTKGMFNVGGNSTSFKKGDKIWNEMPIGTEVFRSDGYLWTKLQDDPPKWQQSHILLWEKANGPIPEGMIVTFLDGDRRNVSLDNLTLITRQEHVRLNGYGYRSDDAEITKTGIQLTRLKIKLIEKRKEKNHD